MKYYSQVKQDKSINILFRGKKNGVFLDIGAHDGVSFSNTYFFEKEKNWTGVCIEPNPEVFKKLQTNRNCILENSCIADKEHVVTFRKVIDPMGGGNYNAISMLSGILDFLDTNNIERIEQEIAVRGGTYEDIPIECKTVDTILLKNNIREVDYCSIDVEGAELLIIKTIDLDKFLIKAFSVENNYGDLSVRNYLKQKGYYCISGYQDDFFVKKFSIIHIPFIVYTKWYVYYRKTRTIAGNIFRRYF